MAIEIIGKPFEFCPDSCPVRALEIVEKYFYCDDDRINNGQSVRCTNERACRYAYELSGKTANR